MGRLAVPARAEDLDCCPRFCEFAKARAAINHRQFGALLAREFTEWIAP
jgi:hypothetical protein